MLEVFECRTRRPQPERGPALMLPAIRRPSAAGSMVAEPFHDIWWLRGE